MHGIGNDFVVINTFSQSVELDSLLARQIADRRFGIGCDQILLLAPPDNSESDVRYRIFNADGGEVMQCGNGARCAAMYLNQKGIINKDTIVAEIGAGILTLCLRDQGVMVNMGVPVFEPAQIPLAMPTRSGLYTVEIDGRKHQFAAVSMGNPHAVFQIDAVAAMDVASFGKAVQASALFPEGVNVGFMEIKGKHQFRLRVYERAAGETLACGSGACAAAVIACQQGLLEGTIVAELNGGKLTLEWAGEGEPVYMTGPAAIVFEGDIEL